MLIPKADRKAIHSYLFKEGVSSQTGSADARTDKSQVLVAKKDYNLPKHGEIDTKNLYVRFSPAA
jgi:small subunit ribosomal protein S10e